MQVKIGDTVYDGAKQPVMVILSPEDKQNILNMEFHATKYCSYPEKMPPREAMEFMEIIWEDDDIGSPTPALGEGEAWEEKPYAQLRESFKVGWDRCYGAHKVSEKDGIVKAVAKIQGLLPRVKPEPEATLKPGEPAVDPATLVLSTNIGCPKGTLRGGDCCGCIVGEHDKGLGGYVFRCNECGEAVGSGGFTEKKR